MNLPRQTMLLVGLFACVAHSAEPPSIAKNPFARPAWEALEDQRVPLPADSDTRISLDLRATMVGASGALANVSGKVIGPGEMIQGYELAAVYEDRAEFMHNGKRFTVYVRPPADENDE